MTATYNKAINGSPENMLKFSGWLMSTRARDLATAPKGRTYNLPI